MKHWKNHLAILITQYCKTLSNCMLENRRPCFMSLDRGHTEITDCTVTQNGVAWIYMRTELSFVVTSLVSWAWY